jgi:hypothetical protein
VTGARRSKREFSTLELVRRYLTRDEQGRLHELEAAANAIEAEMTADEKLQFVGQLSRGVLELVAERQEHRDEAMIVALELVDAVPQSWDEPGWSCCGDPECPFVHKCLDTERLDAAWLLLRRQEQNE